MHGTAGEGRCPRSHLGTPRFSVLDLRRLDWAGSKVHIEGERRRRRRRGGALGTPPRTIQARDLVTGLDYALRSFLSTPHAPCSRHRRRIVSTAPGPFLLALHLPAAHVLPAAIVLRVDLQYHLHLHRESKRPFQALGPSESMHARRTPMAASFPSSSRPPSYPPRERYSRLYRVSSSTPCFAIYRLRTMLVVKYLLPRICDFAPLTLRAQAPCAALPRRQGLRTLHPSILRRVRRLCACVEQRCARAAPCLCGPLVLCLVSTHRPLVLLRHHRLCAVSPFAAQPPHAGSSS
ncbi:hypothetical protein C8R45DRAFT_575217 [Mycena sanguinolenta]|nr:hypothetical protein C8R45DRAFT_575217 [Mycena sanguinolenta]